MKLKNMSKEELELMSYTDLTEMLIKENRYTYKYIGGDKNDERV